MVAHEKISGPFTFHDNCTINLVANVFDDSGNLTRTSTLSGVLIDNGNQIRAISNRWRCPMERICLRYLSSGQPDPTIFRVLGLICPYMRAILPIRIEHEVEL